ncbi:Tail fiber domain-containing protein [Sulfidibacter corallicola]|uniref:Tail fiber domain-containing protein n=1 Tax=Sulfidibacter corallicola TaxID=2818388 RepID=A0A8A4TP98_SULCO|nr:tail fiber domain-containing protein [Sulfidibacter corallicola]QTD51257.1 tail fiber domain-containing protein [Sulfidibacter corallicola]
MFRLILASMATMLTFPIFAGVDLDARTFVYHQEKLSSTNYTTVPGNKDTTSDPGWWLWEETGSFDLPDLLGTDFPDTATHVVIRAQVDVNGLANGFTDLYMDAYPALGDFTGFENSDNHCGHTDVENGLESQVWPTVVVPLDDDGLIGWKLKFKLLANSSLGLTTLEFWIDGFYQTATRQDVWNETATGVYLVPDHEDVGIGTFSPQTKVHVESGTDAMVRIETTNAAGDAGVEFKNSHANVNQAYSLFNHNNDGKLFLWDDTANACRLSVQTNGNIGIGRTDASHPIHMSSGAHVTSGGVWTNASSRALKHRIADLSPTEAQSALMRLQPKRYQYLAEPGEEYLGFIAEDVPDLVAMTGRKSLSAMDLAALLTTVVQAQAKELERLEAQIQQLQQDK